MPIETDAARPARRVIAGLPPGYDAVRLLRLAREAGPAGLLHVAADRLRLDHMARCTRFFAPALAPEVEILVLPSWDRVPYEHGSPSPALSAVRVATLERLGTPAAGPRLVLTEPLGLLRRLPPRAAFAEQRLRAQPGGIDADALEHRLLGAGYGPAEEVLSPGDFRRTDDLVEVFPPGAGGPVRLRIAGDRIEDAVDLPPLSEVVLDDRSAGRFLAACRRRFGQEEEGDDPLAAAVAAGRRHAGMEHWLPLFLGGAETLFDWLPDAALVLDGAAEEQCVERSAQVRAAYEGRAAAARVGRRAHLPVYRPLPPEELFLEEGEWRRAFGGRAVTVLLPDGPEPGQEDGGGRAGPDLSGEGALAAHIAAAGRRGVPVLLAARRGGMLRPLMREAACPVPVVARFDPGEAVSAAVLPLPAGFVAPDLVVAARSDMTGRDEGTPAGAGGGEEGDPLALAASALAPGDLVVHADHGVGLCDGLEEVDAGGVRHACVRLVYRGNDRLLVPVENLDLLWRYGPGGMPASLDKLGSETWAARLGRVVADVMAQARALAATAAKRQAARVGPIFPPPSYRRFVDRFPYAETEGQSDAIDAVLADLAAGRPMDRLLVADVGFGKTEVALRAAFCVAAAGRQVAVIAPTLPLARQHVRDFRARFEGFGIEIAEVMRGGGGSGGGAGPGEARRSLREGRARIAIGTHALLGRGVRFADLGLLVVDEEQRFGVDQKERLKRLAAGVHVLAMSATPIPRTLQMAFAGLRDLSTIATPPVTRRPVATRVLEYDAGAVREALVREHRRGGQSFYVCPRVSDLERVGRRLAELVPGMRVAVAHGRMKPDEMDEVVTGFAQGGADILLATNIIESGLNIPTANTLVVHRADMFGLAQLHQLRGRVGRGAVRAFCLLTTEPGRPVSDEAAQRLAVIAAHGRPGAGAELAQADLDLRGAGNLAGEEQSGHLREVGAELFQDLFRRAVAAVRAGGEVEAFWTPRINLDLPVAIPESYVPDLALRLSLYRAIARLGDGAAAEAFATALAERFGPPPQEVAVLLRLAGLKQACRHADVDELDIGPKGLLVGFRSEPDLAGFLEEHPQARGRHDGRLVVPLGASGGTGNGRFEEVRRVLDRLAAHARAGGRPAGRPAELGEAHHDA